MKKCIRLTVLAAIVLTQTCGCSLPENVKEDLAYIKENADKIGDAIAENPDILKSESEPAVNYTEDLVDKYWTLCAIEDEYGYTDKIYEDEEKRFLLLDEWIMVWFDPWARSEGNKGDLKVKYMNGDVLEQHIYHYEVDADGFSIYHQNPDSDYYNNDVYNITPSDPDWPYMLPLKDEFWRLSYDSETEMVIIDRVYKGQEEPYMRWYLEGEDWYPES